MHHRPRLLIQMFARFRSARPDIKLDLIDGTAQSIEEQLIGSKAKRHLRADVPWIPA